MSMNVLLIHAKIPEPVLMVLEVTYASAPVNTLIPIAKQVNKQLLFTWIKLYLINLQLLN